MTFVLLARGLARDMEDHEDKRQAVPHHTDATCPYLVDSIVTNTNRHVLQTSSSTA